MIGLFMSIWIYTKVCSAPTLLRECGWLCRGPQICVTCVQDREALAKRMPPTHRCSLLDVAGALCLDVFGALDLNQRFVVLAKYSTAVSRRS